VSNQDRFEFGHQVRLTSVQGVVVHTQISNHADARTSTHAFFACGGKIGVPCQLKGRTTERLCHVPATINGVVGTTIDGR
jgi:hypothetical protein